MPYERPGERYYPVTCTKVVQHGDPTVEDGIVGIAIKQLPAPFGTGLNETDGDGNRLLTTIAEDEAFVIDIKGIVEIPDIDGGASKGGLLYIKESDNSFDDSSGSGFVPFGRVVELSGERGTPDGKIRVNLDLKV